MKNSRKMEHVVRVRSVNDLGEPLARYGVFDSEKPADSGRVSTDCVDLHALSIEKSAKRAAGQTASASDERPKTRPRAAASISATSPGRDDSE